MGRYSTQQSGTNRRRLMPVASTVQAKRERGSLPGICICIFVDVYQHSDSGQYDADVWAPTHLQDFGFRVIAIRHDRSEVAPEI